MLPKQYRLDSKKIPDIAKYGKKYINGYFLTRVWFDDKLTEPKFAISISTKIDKRATIRNKIKRKIRAAIIELINEGFKFRKASYLIIIKNPNLYNLDQEKIIELIKNIY